MTRSILAALTLAAIVTLVVPPSQAAGSRVEFTPVVAHVEPTASQLDDLDTPLTIRQSAVTAYGGRVGWWVIPRVGVEAGVLVGSSSLDLVANEFLSLHAQSIYVDARVRVRLTDPSADTGLDIIGGLGLSNLDDPLSDFGDDVGIESPSVFTGIVGVGATTRITDRIQVRFDVADYIHGANLEIDEDAFGTPIDGNTQHDIMVSAGLVITVWEK